MKINVKNLKNESLLIELEPTEPVQSLRQILADKYSSQVNQVKLIYKSKEMDPLKPIIDYELKETDSIICMVLKVNL